MTTFKARLIPVEGEIRDVDVPGNSLSALRKLIGGGGIDQTRVPDPATGSWAMMIVDDEGLLKELPVNERATAMAKRRDNSPIVGDVVVFDKKTWEAYDETYA